MVMDGKGKERILSQDKTSELNQARPGRKNEKMTRQACIFQTRTIVQCLEVKKFGLENATSVCLSE